MPGRTIDVTADKGLPSIWKEGFVPKKNRGQNFLVNRRILEKITREAGLTENDLVVEVGTGPGNLTEHLARTGAQVISFETDAALVAYASRQLSGMVNVILHHQDFLETDLAHHVAEFPGRAPVIVGNLPYAITSPVLFKVLESDVPWRAMVLMVQKEFADRLLAPPGTRQTGLLSLAASLVAETERVLQVSRRSFWPVPRIDSTVVRLFPKTFSLESRIRDRILALARPAFQQRRKKLTGVLNKAFPGRVILPGDLVALGIRDDARPENLTIDQWIALATRSANDWEPA
ncbi:MAG TPA: 16S rRNA (adenine(1518)-N(6)/adenine(1519)-N(6))-dimethyltransferase RsmA [Atribacteraceae bacterium]|nr:16S rRNA (adenine(1518)-N(6)/adenine(1519)-N(6))-dimethyltransferase RsmA [Atribacteraceae bacterium]